MWRIHSNSPICMYVYVYRILSLSLYIYTYVYMRIFTSLYFTIHLVFFVDILIFVISHISLDGVAPLVSQRFPLFWVKIVPTFSCGISQFPPESISSGRREIREILRNPWFLIWGQWSRPRQLGQLDRLRCDSDSNRSCFPAVQHEIILVLEQGRGTFKIFQGDHQLEPAEIWKSGIGLFCM